MAEPIDVDAPSPAPSPAVAPAPGPATGAAPAAGVAGAALPQQAATGASHPRHGWMNADAGPATTDAPQTNMTRREEETARKDRSLGEFMGVLDGYEPLVRFSFLLPWGALTRRALDS